MADTTTLNETIRTPLDGTESVRLATSGSNWKSTLSSIFVSGSAPSSGFVNNQHSAFGTGSQIDVIIFDPGGQNLTLPGNATINLSDTISNSTTASHDRGIRVGTAFTLSGAGTGANAQNPIALDISPTFHGTGELNPAIALNCQPNGLGHNLFDQLYAGVFSIIYTPQSGSSNLTADIATQGQNQGGVINFYDSVNIGPDNRFSGTINNRYTGLYIQLFQDSGGTCPGSCYGIYLNDCSGIGATTSWNFYSQGTSTFNVFDGLIINTPRTVASLPAASAANQGARLFVTDANATTFASIVAGSGTNKLPVYSDGTNWRIG